MIHRNSVTALIFETAMGVAYGFPNDALLKARSQQFFQEASERYLAAKHVHREGRCCIRYSCLLYAHGDAGHAEYTAARAVKILSDFPPTSMLAVAHLNRAVFVAAQMRPADAETHAAEASAVLKLLPPLKRDFMQTFESNIWLIKKMRDLMRTN